MGDPEWILWVWIKNCKFFSKVVFENIKLYLCVPFKGKYALYSKQNKN